MIQSATLRSSNASMPMDTIRTEQFFVQLLFPVVLPVAMPLSALAGGLITQSLMKTRYFTSMGSIIEK